MNVSNFQLSNNNIFGGGIITTNMVQVCINTVKFLLILTAGLTVITMFFVVLNIGGYG